ncbi:DNA repair protein RAD2 [Astathelohania contejeani]|uniref:DNA repair protein RAD2 n=1 Tax=Astathelohania contejeani TaxID=164912 RepID=A0ABQ7HZ10_9MICR|nr:DNA repair protein RAD2 [Thelohania contejeani]
MGVKNLWKILKPAARQNTPSNTRLAIDTSIWLYHYRMLPHTVVIDSFIRRVLHLLYHRIKPIFVFDGQVPHKKKEIIKKRRIERWKQNIEEEDIISEEDDFDMSRIYKHEFDWGEVNDEGLSRRERLEKLAEFYENRCRSGEVGEMDLETFSAIQMKNLKKRNQVTQMIRELNKERGKFIGDWTREYEIIKEEEEKEVSSDEEFLKCFLDESLSDNDGSNNVDDISNDKSNINNNSDDAIKDDSSDNIIDGISKNDIKGDDKNNNSEERNDIKGDDKNNNSEEKNDIKGDDKNNNSEERNDIKGDDKNNNSEERNDIKGDDKNNNSEERNDIIIKDINHTSIIKEDNTGNAIIKNYSINIIKDDNTKNFVIKDNNGSITDNTSNDRPLKRILLEHHELRETSSVKFHIKKILELFNIPFIDSPYEADSQCGYLSQVGLVDGIVTEDSDVFLYGGKKIYRNFFSKNNPIEEYDMEIIKSTLGLQRDDLIKLSYYLGSDCSEGVKGVGPIKAQKLLKEGMIDNFDGLIRIYYGAQVKKMEKINEMGDIKIRSIERWLRENDIEESKIENIKKMIFDIKKINIYS